jgi:hypothetical protein
VPAHEYQARPDRGGTYCATRNAARDARRCSPSATPTAHWGFCGRLGEVFPQARAHLCRVKSEPVRVQRRASNCGVVMVVGQKGLQLGISLRTQC